MRNDDANQKCYPRFDFRLGDLAPALEKRAASESKVAGKPVPLAKIMRRALRDYLDGGDNALPYFDTLELIDTIESLRRDLAKVGGNLNQLAYQFNIHGHLNNDDDLAKVHAELRVEFRKITETLRELENVLYKRK